MLACDDRVIALSFTVRGISNDSGGPFEIAFGMVLVAVPARSGVDQYEPHDHQAMLTRFAELGGGQGPLGDRPPERWAAEFLRLWASPC